MNLKKFLKPLLTACLVLSMAVGVSGCGKESEHIDLNIATGGTAGTYYPIGNAISEVINENVQGVNTSVQASGASVANIDMIRSGQVEMAIVQNDIAYYAITGTRMFDKKVENMRGISSLYSEACQFVTLADSGIETISDLRGKRVVVGTSGSGVEANANQILQAYGLTYDDIEESYFNFAEGANALKSGRVDAICVTAGYPTASINDIAEEQNIRIIPLDEDKITQLIMEYPFYTQVTIPAGTYKGMDEDILTVGVNAIIIASDKLSAKAGYDITKAIFQNPEKILASHPAASTIDKKFALVGMGFIEMNEGAENFIKE